MRIPGFLICRMRIWLCSWLCRSPHEGWRLSSQRTCRFRFRSAAIFEAKHFRSGCQPGSRWQAESVQWCSQLYGRLCSQLCIELRSVSARNPWRSTPLISSCECPDNVNRGRRPGMNPVTPPARSQVTPDIMTRDSARNVRLLTRGTGSRERGCDT